MTYQAPAAPSGSAKQTASTGVTIKGEENPDENVVGDDENAGDDDDETETDAESKIESAWLSLPTVLTPP